MLWLSGYQAATTCRSLNYIAALCDAPYGEGTPWPSSSPAARNTPYSLHIRVRNFALIFSFLILAKAHLCEHGRYGLEVTALRPVSVELSALSLPATLCQSLPEHEGGGADLSGLPGPLQE